MLKIGQSAAKRWIMQAYNEAPTKVQRLVWLRRKYKIY